MTEVLFNGENIILPTTLDEKEMNMDSIIEEVNMEDTREFNPNDIQNNMFYNYNLEKTLEFDERIGLIEK